MSQPSSRDLIAGSSINFNLDPAVKPRDDGLLEIPKCPKYVVLSNRAMKWLKKTLIPLLTLLSGSIFAAPADFQLHQMPSAYHFSFDSLHMKNGERNLGLIGVSYRIKPLSWLYTGVTAFGAVQGLHGGLFVLGFSGGVEYPLIGDMLFGDVGVDIGGGGGRVSEVGNGFMVRPHVGLLYNFGPARAGVTYSKVKFPNGTIDSNQFGVALTIPTDILYGKPSYNGMTVDSVDKMDVSALGQLYFENFYFAPLIQNYYLASGSKDTSGKAATGHISQVGIELGKFINPYNYPIFIFIKAGGAFHGSYNGYMDVIGGAGYHYRLSPSLFINGRLGVGAGGGGNTDTGGGVLLQPSVALQWQFAKCLSTELEGGYLYAPDGKFKAPSATLKIIYSTMLADTSILQNNGTLPKTALFRGWRVRVANQTYLKAQRKTVPDRTTNLVEFKIDAYFNHYLYATGQAGSAYTDKAGGYSTGMLGAGLTSPKFLNQTMDAGIEMLAGAGGGGGMNVDKGLILQPKALLEYYITPYVSANAEIGRVYAPQGSLNATTIDLGLGLHFAMLEGDNH